MGASRRGRVASKIRRNEARFDPLEGRTLLAASLAPIPNITVPAALGFQVPLDGSGTISNSQTFTVTSSNPDIKATVAQGDYLTLNITHASSGPTDPPSAAR